MLKDLTVRWWIEKTTLLEEKNLFSLLRVYEQVFVFSRLHNRQVWSPGIPPLPPPTLPKAQVLPLKLHIVRKVSNIELWPIPCVVKYWRLDMSFNKKKNHHCMPPSMAKTIMSPLPPSLSVSIPKKLSIISWSSIRTKAKVLLRVLCVIVSGH